MGQQSEQRGVLTSDHVGVGLLYASADRLPVLGSIVCRAELLYYPLAPSYGTSVPGVLRPGTDAVLAWLWATRRRLAELTNLLEHVREDQPPMPLENLLLVPPALRQLPDAPRNHAQESPNLGLRKRNPLLNFRKAGAPPNETE
eukprot:3827035-Rhodomonas_salina.2